MGVCVLVTGVRLMMMISSPLLFLHLILKVTRKNHQRTRIEEVEEEEEEREYHHQRAYKYVQNSQRIVISV